MPNEDLSRPNGRGIFGRSVSASSTSVITRAPGISKHTSTPAKLWSVRFVRGQRAHAVANSGVRAHPVLRRSFCPLECERHRWSCAVVRTVEDDVQVDHEKGIASW